MLIEAGTLAGLPGIRHGFFGAEGGVSTGIYASLNCGVGSDDDPDAVAENRRRVAAHFDLAPERLATLYQVHSAEVVTVTAPADTIRARADAMVTDRPGVLLGVLAADCMPILFADPEADVIGAAHAGWPGARAGVAEATIAAMEALGARRETTRVAIGPCIAQPSYEVGPEYRDRFLADDSANGRFFVASDRAGRFRFDLAGYEIARLGALGLAALEWTGHDTAADPDRFFSHRRNVLDGIDDYGRQIAVIALAGRPSPAPSRA